MTCRSMMLGTVLACRRRPRRPHHRSPRATRRTQSHRRRPASGRLWEVNAPCSMAASLVLLSRQLDATIARAAFEGLVRILRLRGAEAGRLKALAVDVEPRDER